MKETTRYAYEKRIRRLEEEVENLEGYKRVALDIFSTTVKMIDEGKIINKAWVVSCFRDVMK